MSDMKCPFCQQELQEDVGYDGDYSCPNCEEPYFGSPELWQELIRTRKALDVAVDALNKIDKQLMTGIEMTCQAKTALDEIKTALEQKD